MRGLVRERGLDHITFVRTLQQRDKHSTCHALTSERMGECGVCVCVCLCVCVCVCVCVVCVCGCVCWCVCVCIWVSCCVLCVCVLCVCVGCVVCVTQGSVM